MESVLSMPAASVLLACLVKAVSLAKSGRHNNTKQLAINDNREYYYGLSYYVQLLLFWLPNTTKKQKPICFNLK